MEKLSIAGKLGLRIEREEQDGRERDSSNRTA